MEQLCLPRHLSPDAADVPPGGLASAGQTPTGLALTLNLGFSHEITYNIPHSSVSLSVGVTSSIHSGQSPTSNIPTISIFGISKEKVNQVASDIYRLKRPEPYKGKGIRYDGEKLFLKTNEKKNA